LRAAFPVAPLGMPMTSHTPRSRLLRDSRVLRRADEIVDAAASLFAERGFHGASTQAIADVLGMKQASLYYYFPSKEAALQLVCEKGVDGFLDNAEAIVADTAAPLDKLTRLIASHLAPNEVKRDYVKVFINERRYLPQAARRRIGRSSRRIEACFADVLRAGIADGSIRADVDVRLTVLAILGMCNNVINWPVADQGADVRQTAAGFARLVVHGLKAARSPASRKRS
jgi:TetR/AcrR family transcriptional regulator, cholesterol catabolism regulator